MRLVDIDALDRAMYHKSFEVDDGRNVWNSGLWIRYKIYEEASIEAPTIDAVPVIRCKDCKWFGVGYMCYNTETLGMQPDDYCSLAERK